MQLTADLPNTRAIAISNQGSAVIYLGDSDVTTSTGFPLAVGEYFGLNTGAPLFAIAASGGQDVRVMELD